MRSVLLCSLALLAATASAQTVGLPRFEDYPAGPIYRGRVAPLVESSSPTARMYRTRTRQALAEGVNFAGHYVVARWGCGTGCLWGHIVDARTGRAVADLPSSTPSVVFRPDSRLFVVNPPEDIIEQAAPDAPLESLMGYEQSEYWVLDGGALRFAGALLASDVDEIRRGGPVPALRQPTPGDVLVPLAVGNTWTYAGSDGSTTTLRVTGPEPDGYGSSVLVERTTRDARGERRTVEKWGGDAAVGDGSLLVRVRDDATGQDDWSTYFEYRFGQPVPIRPGQLVERTAVTLGGTSHDAICYTDAPGEWDEPGAQPIRTCFVPRLGMVLDERDGTTLTLTAHTLR